MIVDPKDVKKIVSLASAPPSLKRELHAEMSGMEAPRSLKHIHASEITKPNFCPRKYYLAWTNPMIQDPGSFLATASVHTYNMGNAVQDLVTKCWARRLSVGEWKCRACPHSYFGEHKTSCPACGRIGTLDYIETEVGNEDARIVGHVDLLVQLPGMELLTLVECKIIKSEEFIKLKMPYQEHRLRTLLYLRLAVEKGIKNIDPGRALILYVSRQHGTAAPEVKDYPFPDAHLSPFKEFWVSEDSDMITEELDTLIQLAKWPSACINLGLESIPPRICETPDDSTAKTCGACEVCFARND